jgi:hypothetical protein
MTAEQCQPSQKARKAGPAALKKNIDGEELLPANRLSHHVPVSATLGKIG